MEPSIKRILVPVDFSEYSKSALKYAADFSSVFQAKLYLVYVIEPVIYPADFSIGQISLPVVESELNTRAEEELQNLAVRVLPSAQEFETIVKVGKPFIEIIDSAAENDIDLIIIATHGHTGVEHMLFGSTAEKVVRKAPCPVLSLRDPLKGYAYKK